jgi:hypothetical protein
MNAAQFVAKWRESKLGERQAAQEHFRDLCAVFSFPTPTQQDVSGETYCFEKGTKKSGGGSGWADVWRLNHFAWEYKKKRRNLEDAKSLTTSASWTPFSTSPTPTTPPSPPGPKPTASSAIRRSWETD